MRFNAPLREKAMVDSDSEINLRTYEAARGERAIFCQKRTNVSSHLNHFFYGALSPFSRSEGHFYSINHFL